MNSHTVSISAFNILWKMCAPSLGQEDLQPTPVFLPGKSHGQRSLVGHSTWDHKQSDLAEVT